MGKTIAKSTQAYLDRNNATVRPVTRKDYEEQEAATGHITDAMRDADLIMTYRGREYFVKSTYRDIVGLIRFIKKYHVDEDATWSLT